MYEGLARRDGVDGPLPGNALQGLSSAFDEVDVGSARQLADRRRDEHFARLGARQQPRRDRDSETSDVVAARLDLTGVRTGANTDAELRELLARDESGA